jgi:serine phosphatase RsbU (regulator of sigma subunit)
VTDAADIGARAVPGRLDAPEIATTRLRLALEAALLGLWEWDVVTGQLVWDRAGRATSGVGEVETTRSVAEAQRAVHPADLPVVQAALSHAIATAGTVDVEFRVAGAGGDERWLHVRGRALVGADGEVCRMVGTVLDVTDERRVAHRRHADAERMAGLVAVAQALGDAQSEFDVLQVVSVRGVSLLGARGTALCLAVPGRRVQLVTTTKAGEAVRAQTMELPASHPLPMVDAVATGRAHFHPDRAATVAAFPGAEPTYDHFSIEASAAVPLTSEGVTFGSLSVALAEPYAWRRPDRELLEAFAALTAQALQRIRARDAERAATYSAQRLSEMLQRSLLTDPPEPNDLGIAVRYRPAAREAQVGGDWYDAFLTEGGTTIVIGDVAGHDRTATAGMAQVRNVLRGVATTLGEPPAAVLTALDRALVQLGFRALTTAVLCQVDDRPSAGGRVLRWSNAGHPPPVLVRPDGSAELLWRTPDLLLGVRPDTVRTDHAVPLPDGTTLVLYTDGVVERRGELLDVGLERMRATVAELHRLTPDQLCDALLDRLARGAEDDIALLVLRPGAGR